MIVELLFGMAGGFTVSVLITRYHPAVRRLKKVTLAASLLLDAFEAGQDPGDLNQDELLKRQEDAYRVSNYMTRVYGEPRGRRLEVQEMVLVLSQTQEEMRKL